jgi:gas vesicle protein
MPTGPTPKADEITDSIRSLIDRLVDAKVTHEMAKRGQELAALLADRGSDVGSMAGEAWRESRGMRRDAAKRLARASRDGAKWSDHTWRASLRPFLRDAWKRRTVAIGAAGAAVPAGRELVEEAAVRLGLKEREERHWGAFFFGILLGAAVGAITAMLLTPKRGEEMRRELTARADELATRAKDEWVPMFQRDETTNGHPDDVEAAAASIAEPATAPEVEPATSSVAEGAAAGSQATGGAAEAAADTAEAINDAFDVDREPSA